MAGLVAHGPVALCADRAPAVDVPWEDVVATVHQQMRSLVGPTPDLEDLTQAALEQIVKSLERFEGRAALSTYTYRICAHLALNHFRSWRRWLKRFTWPTAPEHHGAELADDRPGVAERLVEAERSRRLYAALDRLSPTRRLVVTLADLEELPASRIAEILDCPEPTVRSRLRKARRELHELLRRDRLFSKEAP
jgi:RNA polymerase sigma-70 factor, ECF subfamily